MVASIYVPDRGDIVWICFDPRKGHEQKGRRPALVMSARVYNKKAGLVLLCPVTSALKGYPFEVMLPGKKVTGAVLADHVHSFDWRQRRAAFIEKAHPDIIQQVFNKIMILAGNET